MSDFRIPDRFLPGFEILANMEDKEFEKIIRFYKEIPKGIGSNTFEASLSESIGIPDVEDLSLTLYSLGGVLTKDNKHYKQIIDDLTNSLKEKSKISLTSNMLESFKVRLIELFENGENLKITFKASCLISEYGTLFRDANIYTDIRLIFGDDLDSKDRDAVIVHQLKMETRKNGKQKDIFVALDSDDLLVLKEKVDRAIEKEKHIKVSYGNTINYIDVKE